MGTEEFKGPIDDGYLGWLAEHQSGYVLNIQRSHARSDACVHYATCRTISGTPPRGDFTGGQYVKICSDSLAALDAWATRETGSTIRRCGTCQPPSAGTAR